MTTPGPALGVLVPCRNEARVVERRLRNLALEEWPPAPAGRPHRLLVVDDGSSDGTAALAERVLGELFPTDGAGGAAQAVQAEVLLNRRRPGKSGALASGLGLLEHAVDVVVLTDADVVQVPGSLAALARAFAERPRMGMACGSQEFVRDLAADGSCRGADGGDPVSAPGPYDRWTAVVRALESRAGKLFSVHGQLLAWRAALRLEPAPGIAADDLELMRQVRAFGLRVEKLPDARFLEVKTPRGARARAQEMRRARAYVQVIERCRLPRGASLVDRLQFLGYRRLPLAAPSLALLGAALLPLLGHLWGGPQAGAATGALLILFLFSPPGRRFEHLLSVITVARRVEARGPLDDRWENLR